MKFTIKEPPRRFAVGSVVQREIADCGSVMLGANEQITFVTDSGAEYDAWTVNISDGSQFGSGFVDLNPNSKIPTMLDKSGPEPVRSPIPLRTVRFPH